jgi:hypothetical protein
MDHSRLEYTRDQKGSGDHGQNSYQDAGVVAEELGQELYAAIRK